MDVLILKTQDGDWEGMYVDGTLISQGHTLGDGNNFFYLLEMSEKYGFTRKDVRSAELKENDGNLLMNIGALPKELNSLLNTY